MKKGYFLFVLILMVFTFSNVNAQFVSVKDGSWRDAATWSTEPNASAIPDTNSTVYVSHNVIASAVSGTNSECYDLIINPTGTIDCNSSNWVTGSLEIRNDLINNGTINPGHDFYLTIGGNFYNNGITTRHYLSHVQQLSIMGNIYNNGSFHFSKVNFGDYRRANTSEHTHYIKSQNDSTIFLGTANFVDSLGTLIIDSLATLSATFNLNNSKIILPLEITHPNNLELVGGQIYGGEIIANGNTIETKSVVSLGRIQGDENNLIVKNAILEGHYRIGARQEYNFPTSLVVFEGETVLNGVIENIYSSSTLYSDRQGIVIDGNFTNNGSLKNNIDDFLYINILDGNLINNGVIDAGGIKFYGECEFSTTDSISVNNFMGNDSNTVVTITAGELIFNDKTVTIDFNGGILNLADGSKLYTNYMWSNLLQNIIINANGADFRFASIGDNVQINNPKISGGIYYIDDSELKGEIEVTPSGALFPYSRYYPHLIIDGNISNYGRIELSQWSEFYLEVTGDIIHDGLSWTSTETKLNGIYDQAIIIPNDSAWTGKVILDAMLTGTNYQWQKDGVDISGANSQTLDFNSGLSTSDYGKYMCVVDGNSSRIITIGNKEPSAFEIYDVAIENLGATTTQVTWKTTVPATGFIFYAENDATNGYPLEAMEEDGLVLNHSLSLDSLTTGSTYYFIIDQNDENWTNNIRSDEFSFVAGDTTVSVYEESVVSEFSLSQNYPNPFNPSTQINYSIPQSGNVSLIIYDMLGREVKTILDQFQNAGSYSIDFNAEELSSGIYFYQIIADDFVDTKKMILIK